MSTDIKPYVMYQQRNRCVWFSFHFAYTKIQYNTIQYSLKHECFNSTDPCRIALQCIVTYVVHTTHTCNGRTYAWMDVRSCASLYPPPRLLASGGIFTPCVMQGTVQTFIRPMSVPVRRFVWRPIVRT